MKVIIPFKFDSSRCRRKNVREFFDGDSLLDITIKHFLKYYHDIYLVCVDGPETKQLIKKHNVNHIVLNDDSNNWVKVLIELSGTLNKVFGPNEPICFWQCVAPLFWLYNDIQDFISFAEEKICEEECESVVPVYEFADYLVNENMQGINFGPGSWHAVSQDLPKLYYITPMGVSTPAVYEKYRYTYSPNSTMWVAEGPYIDIDTEEEMKIAQILYREKIKESKNDCI